jgi:hypothetical protein
LLTSHHQRAGRLQRRLFVSISAVLAIVIFGGAATFSYLTHRTRDLAEAARWDIRGPACPKMAAEAFNALPIQVKSHINYEGFVVGRAYGHIECQDVPYTGWRSFRRYPACQLTGPAVLSVAVDGKETYFNPGFGNRVTIGLPDGKLTCVIGGNFGVL